MNTDEPKTCSRFWYFLVTAIAYRCFKAKGIRHLYIMFLMRWELHIEWAAAGRIREEILSAQCDAFMDGYHRGERNERYQGQFTAKMEDGIIVTKDAVPVTRVNPYFVECECCQKKSGTPELCSGCLHNRLVIQDLKEDVAYRDLWLKEEKEKVRKLMSEINRTEGPSCETCKYDDECRGVLMASHAVCAQCRFGGALKRWEPKQPATQEKK